MSLIWPSLLRCAMQKPSLATETVEVSDIILKHTVETLRLLTILKLTNLAASKAALDNDTWACFQGYMQQIVIDALKF